jgi:chorismate mutase
MYIPANLATLLIGSFLCLLSAQSCAVMPDNSFEEQEAVTLFKIMNQRLVQMEAVAAYKYLHHLPSFIPGREHKILAIVRAKAQQQGLNVAATQNFIRLQMRIAVQVQNQWHQQWRKDGFDDTQLNTLDIYIPPDMKPLTLDIVEQLVKVLPLINQCAYHATLRHYLGQEIQAPYVTDAQKEQLYESLLKISKP